MMGNMDERRWYKRQTCDFAAEVVSPLSIEGRVVNLSDGGLLIAVFPEDEKSRLEIGVHVVIVVEVSDNFHLSRRQKVQGLVRRSEFDMDTSSWYVAIEAVGAWEDI